MSTTGAGNFYDGFTSARHAVAVELGRVDPGNFTPSPSQNRT